MLELDERIRRPYLYPNGRVDVEALQSLEARVLALENREYAVDGNSREYYEQKIEELSGKWQDADHRAKILSDTCAQLTQERSEQASQIMSLLQEKGEAASTISELRDQLAAKAEAVHDLRMKVGQRDALIGQKNREIEESRELIALGKHVKSLEPGYAVMNHDGLCLTKKIDTEKALFGEVDTK